MATASDLRYTSDSLQAPKLLEESIWKHLMALLREKAAREKRSTITEEDVKGCLPEAVKKALRELETEGILEPTAKCAE